MGAFCQGGNALTFLDRFPPEYSHGIIPGTSFANGAAGPEQKQIAGNGPVVEILMARVYLVRMRGASPFF